MHYRFEIQLIICEILADPVHAGRDAYGLDVLEQHLRRYLYNFHRQNAVLPTGRRYLGMTRPLHIEIGMVDFDMIRAKIQTHTATHRGLGVGDRGCRARTGQQCTAEICHCICIVPEDVCSLNKNI
jgi:hypothetical protein